MAEAKERTLAFVRAVRLGWQRGVRYLVTGPEAEGARVVIDGIRRPGTSAMPMGALLEPPSKSMVSAWKRTPLGMAGIRLLEFRNDFLNRAIV